MEAHVIRNISRPPQNLIKEIGSFEAATVHEAYGGKGSIPE